MMRFLFVLLGFWFGLLGFADEFQKFYIKAMKAYDSGDSLKAFEILEEQISKYTNVPSYFYVKNLFYISDAYYSGKVGFSFFTNVLYRYYNIVLSRNIQDEFVWERIVDVSSEVGIKHIFEESVKNLLLINSSNKVGIYSLIKLLFSERNYESVLKVCNRNIDTIGIPEVFYFLLLSKIYVQDYRDFDRVIEFVVSNYDLDDIRYLASSVYYQIMDFDKAWNMINVSDRIVDYDLYLKLMIARKESYVKIFEFLEKYKNNLSSNLVEFVIMLSNSDSLEFKNYFKKKLISYSDSDFDVVFYELALSYPVGSELYNIGLERLAFNLFSKKLYGKVIDLLSKVKKISDGLKYILALSYREVGDYRKSLLLLEQVKNRFEDAAIRIPLVYIDMGDYKKARDSAKSILRKIVSSSIDMNKYILSQVFLDLGDVESAEKLLKSTYNKNSYYYKMLFATISFYRKNYSASENVLREVFIRNRYDPDVMNSLAFVWATQGKNFDEALRLSKFSLVFDYNYNYLDTLAYVYYRKGDLENAKNFVDLAVLEMEKQKKFNKDIYKRAKDIRKEFEKFRGVYYNR